MVVAGFAVAAMLVWAGPSRAALLPVPKASEQAPTSKLIRDLFAKDYVDRTPAARAALAVKLLKTADEAKQDAAAYYVLVNAAFNVSMDAGVTDGIIG